MCYIAHKKGAMRIEGDFCISVDFPILVIYQQVNDDNVHDRDNYLDNVIIGGVK